MQSRFLTNTRYSTPLALLLLASLLSACIAFLPSGSNKSEEERKWALLGLIGSTEENALISTPPTVSAEGYDPSMFTVTAREDQEEISIPVYGSHFVAVGSIYDLDVDTSQIPGAPEEYETVLLPAGQVAEITYEYDERLLREKGLIEEFQVFSYDKRSGQWIPALDVEVDLENNRVIARTNHFTPFILTALPQPADGGVYDPPQCVLDVLDDPAGAEPGPKWARLDSGFKYYRDRGYTISPNSDFYDLKLDQALGIATCNGGIHSSSPNYCGPQAKHKFSTATDYLDFTLPFDAKVFIMYDVRGSKRANWLADMGFLREEDGYILTTDETPAYEVYSREYSSGSRVTLPGNHYDLDTPNGIRTNYFVAVLPQGDWVNEAGIDCSSEPGRPASPSGISLIPGSDQIAIVLDQSIDREVTGLIVRKRLLEPALSPEQGEAVGVSIQDPGYIIDAGLTEGIVYYYSFFAVTEDSYYSMPLILSAQTAPDTDGDGLANYYEYNPSNVYASGNRTNHLSDDTDGDGISDFMEVLNYTDPTNGDATKPVITLFEDDGTIETIPVARFHVETSDASPITGWFLSESAAPPGPLDTGWSSDEPSVYEVANVGELNLHLWVRDAAGNISDGAQLSLNFPYFHYAESFLRSGNDGFTPSNSFQISVFSGNLIQSTFTDPIIGVGYGQGIVMKLTTAGTLQAYSLDRNGNLELVAETPVLTRYFEISRPATGLTAFHYNAGQDFWLAAAVHPFCPLYQLCVRTVRYDPDGHSFQLLDSRSIYTGLITTELRHHQSFLSDDGRHFALYRFSHLYGFTLEDGKIAESYASNPIEYSIVENGAPAAAFSPNLRWVLLIKGIAPGIRSLRFDPTAQINEDAWTRSVWPVVNNSVTDKIYGSLVFLGEEDVLACSDAGVEHLSLDRNSGSLTRIGLVIDAPGILSEKTVYAAPDGIHFIFRHGTQASLFRFDHDTGLATEVYKLPYQDWGRFDRVTFQTNSRGNRPPSIDFKLPGGYSVLTPSGPLYPFRGIITPNLSCEGDLSAAYASNESSRWTMARIDYSDPDATRCGVDNEPASLEIASTSQPSGNSLAIPMNLYKDLQIDADSPFEVRGFLRAIVGDTARRICPGAFRADGRKEALIPLTPKEPGDYSFTVQATDNQGSCEGRAQTTTSTLRFVARNRYDSRPKEFIRRSDYPAPEAPLRYFSLESRHQKGMSPQPFTQFRCEIHSVICALHGQTFLCLDNTHQGPVILTESEHAQCGPPLFFMTRWTSRTGNSGPLSDYKPLYKYYDKADQYWNESWDQPGFNPVTWENTGLDPFSKQDRRGFLFVQSETLIPLDELYRGEWIGYEDL